ncbi:MAG: hypothetical protein II940_00260 [Methanosarcinaceae archaeon]|nr:hypothetical protein [Methanosarcinaceae archaeon]
MTDNQINNYFKKLKKKVNRLIKKVFQKSNRPKTGKKYTKTHTKTHKKHPELNSQKLKQKIFLKPGKTDILLSKVPNFTSTAIKDTTFGAKEKETGKNITIIPEKSKNIQKKAIVYFI